MTVRISLASIVTDDIESLATFYARTFGFEEVVELRSDIFRGLDVAGTTLGFSTPVVYEMLGIEAWSDPTGTASYLTFEADDDAGVDRLVTAAVEGGATVLHEPYTTYYDAYQAVLADPAGNVFRINHFH